MASTDRITRLTAIRDNLEAELQDETARRAALTAAGSPPPTTYSVGGKSFDWNGYLAATQTAIDYYTQLIAKAKAPYMEGNLRGYT